MKIYLKFDHTQNDTLKAIGCKSDGKQLNRQVAKVIDK